ncbi:MAG: hypothetical protein V1899_03620, partial [Planctomycetota bacterium]
LPEKKALSLLEHLREGNGTRATARLTDVNANTVTRYLRLAGSHSRRAHDELFFFLHSPKKCNWMKSGTLCTTKISEDYAAGNVLRDGSQDTKKGACRGCCAHHCLWHRGVVRFTADTLKQADGTRLKRTPAMSAGLADHIWSIKEWATYPARAP